jgi:hypothetical protein
MEESRQMHRPGFVFSTDAARNAAREKAYREVLERDANAWRGGPRDVPARDAVPAADAAHGDAALADAQAVTDERERAYRLHDIEEANRWRIGK